MEYDWFTKVLSVRIDGVVNKETLVFLLSTFNNAMRNWGIAQSFSRFFAI